MSIFQDASKGGRLLRRGLSAAATICLFAAPIGQASDNMRCLTCWSASHHLSHEVQDDIVTVPPLPDHEALRYLGLQGPMSVLKYGESAGL
jgi:hypothetical protein